MFEQENQSQADDHAAVEQMAAYLQACLENRYFMGAVLVARAGEVLLSAGYGMANLEHNVPNTPQTKFRIGSITKQFTATAILQLQEQGLLQVQNSISNYLPNYPNGEQIAIHHLLNHTSGIPEFVELDDFDRATKLKVTLDEVIAYFYHKPLEFTPGEDYHYTNSGYILLSKIIETVSGHSYADYLQHRILEPLGMLDSGYDRQEMILPHRASGYDFTGEAYHNAKFVDLSWPSGAGGMYSTIADLFKWEQGLHSGTILSKSSRAMMFTPKVTIRAAEGDAGVYHSYGGIICTHYDRKLLYHGGGINGFSTRIARYPDEQVSIIVLNNVETPTAPLPVVLIANALAAILFDQPYELPKQRQAIAVDPMIYHAYVGQYELEPGWVMNVTQADHRLFTQWIGQERVELFAESPTQFFVKVTEAPCTFVVDETGKASHVILHQVGRDRVATRIKHHIR